MHLYYHPRQINVIHLPIFFKINSKVQEKYQDFINATEVTLKDIGKLDKIDQYWNTKQNFSSRKQP